MRLIELLIGGMSFQEFSAFLHPEDAEHMRDIVVQETLEDIDKDGDGHVRVKRILTLISMIFSRLILMNTLGTCTGMREERMGNMVFSFSCSLSCPFVPFS